MPPCLVFHPVSTTLEKVVICYVILFGGEPTQLNKCVVDDAFLLYFVGFLWT